MKIIMDSCRYKGYNTKIKIFNDRLAELTYYNNSLKVGTQEDNKLNLKSDSNKDRKKRCSKPTFSKRNLRSSADKLYGYVMANEDIWLTFLTLTFGDNISEIKDANKCFHTWQVAISQKTNDFKYVGVPEFQKNGRVHYHLITNIPFDSELVTRALDKNGNQIKTYNKKKNKSYLIWNIKYWKYGFSTVMNLKSVDKHFNLASYMAKYLFKDFDNRLYGHQKIMVSKKLKFYDTIYSYEDTCGTMELELGMINKGYLKYSEKFIELDDTNKHMPSSMTILKFDKRELRDEELEAFEEYREDLELEVRDLKKYQKY